MGQNIWKQPRIFQNWWKTLSHSFRKFKNLKQNKTNKAKPRKISHSKITENQKEKSLLTEKRYIALRLANFSKKYGCLKIWNNIDICVIISQPRILYIMKISNLKVKYFFRQKLREFIIKKHTLKKILKEVLQVVEKNEIEEMISKENGKYEGRYKYLLDTGSIK